MPMTTCKECGTRIILARTVPGAAWMPVDPDPHDAADTYANVAIKRDGLGSYYVRALHAGEEPLPNERRHVPHFATCPVMLEQRGRELADPPADPPPLPDALPDNVVPLRRGSR